MIDKFLSDYGVHRVGMILTVASQVIKTFDSEFKKDEASSKQAAINALVEVLLQHKNSVSTEVAE